MRTAIQPIATTNVSPVTTVISTRATNSYPQTTFYPINNQYSNNSSYPSSNLNSTNPTNTLYNGFVAPPPIGFNTQPLSSDPYNTYNN